MAGGALRQVCAGRVSEETLVEAIDRHCKGKYPREFGHKLKSGFVRNERCDNAEMLFAKAKLFDFEDCYCSVYSYSEWSDVAEERRRNVRVDTILFDIDRENLTLAFAEAKKMVKYLIKKDIIPRVYFSGAKGFHIYIDFPEQQLYDFATVKDVAIFFSQKLKVAIDTQIYDPNRVSRLPFTINTKTGYFCVPIPPDKFTGLHLDDILRIAKEPVVYDIEVHENREMIRFLNYYDFKHVLKDMPPLEVNLKKKLRRLKPKLRVEKFHGNWRWQRIQYYANALKKYGSLSADPYIVAIHAKNEHVNDNPGSVEHIARVHLVLLCIEEGMSDREIHEIFKYAHDYDPEKTQKYIDYNRMWLERKRAMRT